MSLDILTTPQSIIGIIIVVILLAAGIISKNKANVGTVYKTLSKEANLISGYIKTEITHIDSVYGTVSYEEFQAEAIKRIISNIAPYILEELKEKASNYPALSKVLNSDIFSEEVWISVLSEFVNDLVSSNDTIMEALEAKYDYIIKQISDMADETDNDESSEGADEKLEAVDLYGNIITEASDIVDEKSEASDLYGEISDEAFEEATALKEAVDDYSNIINE